MNNVPSQHRETVVRQGFTLIEMVTVMGLAGTVVGLAIAIIVLGFKVDDRSQEQIRHDNGMARFANEFRDQVHRHTWEEISLDEKKLSLTSSTRATQQEFVIQNDRIRWRKTEEGNGKASYETFSLNPDWQVRWKRDEANRLVRAQIVEKQPSAKATASPVKTWEIIAAPGRLLPPADSENGSPSTNGDATSEEDSP